MKRHKVAVATAAAVAASAFAAGTLAPGAQAWARALAAAIPDCTARVAPGGGHFFYSRSLAEIIGSLLPDDVAVALAAA